MQGRAKRMRCAAGKAQAPRIEAAPPPAPARPPYAAASAAPGRRPAGRIPAQHARRRAAGSPRRFRRTRRAGCRCPSRLRKSAHWPARRGWRPARAASAAEVEEARRGRGGEMHRDLHPTSPIEWSRPGSATLEASRMAAPGTSPRRAGRAIHIRCGWQELPQPLPSARGAGWVVGRARVEAPGRMKILAATKRWAGAVADGRGLDVIRSLLVAESPLRQVHLRGSGARACSVRPVHGKCSGSLIVRASSPVRARPPERGLP